MRAVKDRDSAAELRIRRLIFGWGYRYRLHRGDLPGKPDIVLPSRRKIVFVNGCFWHGHPCPRGARIPKRHRAYWLKKIAGNRNRDKLALEALNELRWSVLVVWECELKEPDKLLYRLKRFLQR